MKLTHENLNLEYVEWNISNGNGRSSQDLRFGQYLWSKYEDMNEFTDVFNFESAERAYSTLLKELNETKQEN